MDKIDKDKVIRELQVMVTQAVNAGHGVVVGVSEIHPDGVPLHVRTHNTRGDALALLGMKLIKNVFGESPDLKDKLLAQFIEQAVLKTLGVGEATALDDDPVPAGTLAN